MRLRSCVLGLIMGVGLLRSATAQATPADVRGIAVLLDVSGSMKRRDGPWHQSIQETVDGILAGSTTWRRDWIGMNGDSTVLAAVGADVPTQFAVVPFGAASLVAPYINVHLEPTRNRSERQSKLRGKFPDRSRFTQGLSYVKLAQAATEKRFAEAGITSGFLVVVSDFEQDAQPTFEQRQLIQQSTTSSLPLRRVRSFAAQASALNGIEILILELAVPSATSAAPTSKDPPPVIKVAPPAPVVQVGGLRLLRPGATATTGSVTFAWDSVPGTVTYMLELARTDGKPTTRQFVVPSNQKAVDIADAGSYKWTVRARDAGLRPLGTASKQLLVNDGEGGGGGGAILIVLLLLLLAGGGVWFWRRRRLQRSAL